VRAGLPTWGAGVKRLQGDHGEGDRIPPLRMRSKLDNQTCPYCGRDLRAVGSTKEHVVGKRFVPKGTMAATWNLILKACPECNARKADFEDEMSAASMQPNIFGNLARPDEQLRIEARRKGRRSISRLTGKTIVKSPERLQIKGQLAQGLNLSVSLVAPPQLMRERVYALAGMQISAFFYLITFNPDMKRGFCLIPVAFSHRGDWGNSVQTAFMSSVREWDPRLIAETAQGYFKVAIRRQQPPLAPCWSWALEWNESIRVIGFLGDEQSAATVCRGFPKQAASTIPLAEGHLEITREIPLQIADDTMFSSCGSI